MFYNVKYEITNIYDGTPLQIVGRVEVFIDLDKKVKITEMPFTQLGLYLMVSECPTESKEILETYINTKAMEVINVESIQNKLAEIKQLYDIGLLGIVE